MSEQLKNMAVRKKLMILVTFTLISIVGIGVISLLFMNSINKASTEIADNCVPSIIAAEEINTSTSDYRINEFKLIIATDKAEMDGIIKDLDEKAEEVNANISAYNKVITNDTDKKMIEDITSGWNSYLELSNKIRELAYNNENDKATESMKGESLNLFSDVSNKALELVNFNKTYSDEASEAGDKSFKAAIGITVALLIVISIFSILVALRIIASLVKPIREIDNIAQKIADGNLDEAITYESKDELGALAVNFNKTVTRLRDYVNYIDEISSVLDEIASGNLVYELTYDYFGEFAKIKTALINISDSLNDTMKQITQNADQVSAGSEQLAESAQALAEGSTDQAGAVEELLATTNDVTDKVKTNAESAETAANKTTEVARKTEESKEQINRMTTAMKNINDTSQKVVTIIQAIEEIAAQTNMLSLNASIEAARAGEAGKGFAVVANEIGKLAEESSQAANNTRNLIQLSMDEIEKGNSIVEEIVHSLEAVVEGVDIVNSLIDDTKEASLYQAEAVDQIQKGIEEISSVVQNNSATAEETSATSEELAAQAENLNVLVGRFKLRN